MVSLSTRECRFSGERLLIIEVDVEVEVADECGGNFSADSETAWDKWMVLLPLSSLPLLFLFVRTSTDGFRLIPCTLSSSMTAIAVATRLVAVAIKVVALLLSPAIIGATGDTEDGDD
jgi:hypothetical protein